MNFKNNKGFTIIETMISIGIFLIIVTIGMEALLNSSFIHSKSESQRSGIDSLSFMMEDMSRNIRMGSQYSCTDDAGNDFVGDCNSQHQYGEGISFKPSNSDNGHKITYYLDGSGDLLKVVDGVSSQLNPTDVNFFSDNNPTDSSFTITGASSTDSYQPFVTIRLVGEIVSPKGNIPFSLQTSVSQRLIDIQPVQNNNSNPS